MNQYDLALYGHLTIDHIIKDFKENISLGAIANFWIAIKKINNVLKVKLNPCAIGDAIILVDECMSQRVGRGNLNTRCVTPEVVNSRWHHIMYLNQLKDMSFISDIKSGIISADTTAGSMVIREQLKHIDYLFISDEDLDCDVEELASLVKGWVILHYPGGSYSSDGTRNITKTNDVIKNINILGAGDTFAACFISSMLMEDNIDNALDYAHENTIKVLTDEI